MTACVTGMTSFPRCDAFPASHAPLEAAACGHWTSRPGRWSPATRRPVTLPPPPPSPIPPRVRLRDWTDLDLAAFTRMNADPKVMRFFPAMLSAEESRASYFRIRSAFEARGWGLWAVATDGRFAGFTGLAEPAFRAPFTPCVEIGWRLRREFWGRGVAFTAATQAIDHAFTRLRLPELVSFTSVHNLRSRTLMERLDFTHNPLEDFDHPSLQAGSPLRRHVLYRMPADAPV